MVKITEEQRLEVMEHLTKLMFYLDKKSQKAISIGVCSLNGTLEINSKPSDNSSSKKDCYGTRKECHKNDTCFECPIWIKEQKIKSSPS